MNTATPKAAPIDRDAEIKAKMEAHAAAARQHEAARAANPTLSETADSLLDGVVKADEPGVFSQAAPGMAMRGVNMQRDTLDMDRVRGVYQSGRKLLDEGEAGESPNVVILVGVGGRNSMDTLKGAIAGSIAFHAAVIIALLEGVIASLSEHDNRTGDAAHLVAAKTLVEASIKTGHRHRREPPGLEALLKRLDNAIGGMQVGDTAGGSEALQGILDMLEATGADVQVIKLEDGPDGEPVERVLTDAEKAEAFADIAMRTGSGPHRMADADATTATAAPAAPDAPATSDAGTGGSGSET